MFMFLIKKNYVHVAEEKKLKFTTAFGKLSRLIREPPDIAK